MPGLWKAWKAESRLPTLSTSPLGISPTAGEIPTFPQRRRRRRMEKWKTKSRFSTFPPPRFPSLKTKTQRRGFAPRCQNPTKGDAPQQSARTEIVAQFQAHSALEYNHRFQAHPALESILDFRLISGLENA